MFAFLMGLKSVTPAEVLELTKNGRATVIDVNAPARWAQAHVPGAVNLDPMQFDAGALPPDKDATLVFYCSNPMCRKAPNAARRAKAMGYRDARVMSAGINGWVDKGMPVEP